MVLWQGTPLITILGPKYRLGLRNHLVFNFKSELKSKRERSKNCFLPLRVHVNPALAAKLKLRLVGATKTNPT